MYDVLVVGERVRTKETRNKKVSTVSNQLKCFSELQMFKTMNFKTFEFNLK